MHSHISLSSFHTGVLKEKGNKILLQWFTRYKWDFSIKLNTYIFRWIKTKKQLQNYKTSLCWKHMNEYYKTFWNLYFTITVQEINESNVSAGLNIKIQSPDNKKRDKIALLQMTPWQIALKKKRETDCKWLFDPKTCDWQIGFKWEMSRDCIDLWPRSYETTQYFIVQTLVEIYRNHYGFGMRFWYHHKLIKNNLSDWHD